MGFWGQVENVAVNGVAGVAGAIEQTEIPLVAQAAEGVAVGVHGIDAAGHGIAAGYDALTGDSEGAAHQGEIAAGQGLDAVAAAIPLVSAVGAASDLAHVATSFGSEGQEGATPTLGEMGVDAAKGLWNAL
jgi:hypothetical protein